MKNFKNISYFIIGFLIAAFTISLTSVGAQVSEGINRVFIANDVKNPIPVISREVLKIQGDVKIEGKPEVRLDGDTKIKIESVDKPVIVRFDKSEAMPETSIFKIGKKYSIKLVGTTPKRCEVDKINGTWIFCERKRKEGEIVGWVNTLQIAVVTEL